MDFIDSFKNQMALDGIITQESIIADGEIHRFRIDGDSTRSLNGWYVLYGDSVPSGAYGCWKRSISKTWCLKAQETMSAEQWAEHLNRIKIAQERQTDERHQAQIKIREKAQKIWGNAQPADTTHPYLIKKNILAYGVRVDQENRLLVLSDPKV